MPFLHCNIRVEPGRRRARACWWECETGALRTFPNPVFTRARLEYSKSALAGETNVDVIFLLTIVALYAVTAWIVRGISRLGGGE